MFACGIDPAPQPLATCAPHRVGALGREGGAGGGGGGPGGKDKNILSDQMAIEDIVQGPLRCDTLLVLGVLLMIKLGPEDSQSHIPQDYETEGPCRCRLGAIHEVPRV